ncbi:MAG: hypothetical protein HQL95_12050, partial [Magnetococcales bacterium]|nr:hypothetical protein [Magnetococcales bacterium]
MADKSLYSNLDNSLQSFGGGLGTITILGSTTTLGNANNQFGSQVVIGEGSKLIAASSASKGGLFRIETVTDVFTVDKVRVDAVGLLAINTATVQQNANLMSDVRVNGAELRNLNGDLEIATQTNATLTANTNSFAASAVGGAGSNTSVILGSDNRILLNNAELSGQDVKLLAGQTRDRVANELHSTARADMTTVALFGMSVPVVSNVLAENNLVDLQGSTSVRAVRHVDMVAEKGIGSERAKIDGLVLNIGLIPYGFEPTGTLVDLSTNLVKMSDKSTVEAGMNYLTEIQILPLLINGESKLAEDRLGKTLTDAEKLALKLDKSQQYEYAPLDMEDVSMGVSTGTIVEAVAGAFGKGVAGQYYEFAPGSYKDESLILEKEDYTDTKRWKEVTPDHQIDATTANLGVSTGETVRTQTGQWARRTGSATTVSSATDFSGTGWTEILSLKSDKGYQFAMKLSDDFYVVKPRSVAL